MQIITGLFLSIYYTSSLERAFQSVLHLTRDVNFGWALRALHFNGASFFFILIFTHIGRGVYYGSYVKKETWNIGVILLLLSIATAFLGYVLPWGQMSFWGATVITNLLSAVPYFGPAAVEWVWGGFSVAQPTLIRLFSLHFLIPFGIAAGTIAHLFFLHEKGSNNPLGVVRTKTVFHPYFTYKDIVGFLILFLCIRWLIFFSPQILGDPENFREANSLVTPVHIQPEWYFLFAYAILRCVPRKLGGVVALALSVVIFLSLPLTRSYLRGNSFSPINQYLFWGFVITWALLRWLGAKPVEPPFILLSQILSLLYFSFFCCHPLSLLLWDYILWKPSGSEPLSD